MPCKKRSPRRAFSSARFAVSFFLVSLIVAIAALAAALLLHRFYTARQAAQSASSVASSFTYVIDAGHGGEDGGTSGGGQVEKELNLAVSESVGALMELCGYPIVMTRTDDRLLYDHYGELSDYTGKKKTYDLKNRLAIAKEAENPVLLSIHMNAFPEAQYKGLQVYYAATDERSRALAESIQSTVKARVAPGNDRKIKRAAENIYLLDRADFPAVLIECGFLSNPEECALLATDDYRACLAAAIVSAVASFEASA